MLRKRIQLALIHVSVAMALVPIKQHAKSGDDQGTGNIRHTGGYPGFITLPFFSLQVAIGSYSDRHPWFGYRRTPYIALGLALCVLGVILAPYVVFFLPVRPLLGLLLSLLAFGAWGWVSMSPAFLTFLLPQNYPVKRAAHARFRSCGL